MNNQLIKLEPSQEELQSIEQMIGGCDSAVVTYAVDKDYNVHKAVTLFTRTSSWIYQFENYSAEHNRTLAENPNICLTKTYNYTIKNKQLKMIGRDYNRVLFRDLNGFVCDEFTHDLRKKYANRY